MSDQYQKHMYTLRSMAEMAAKNAGNQISTTSGLGCLFAYFKFASNDGMEAFRNEVIQQNISHRCQVLNKEEIAFILQ